MNRVIFLLFGTAIVLVNGDYKQSIKQCNFDYKEGLELYCKALGYPISPESACKILECYDTIIESRVTGTDFNDALEKAARQLYPYLENEFHLKNPTMNYSYGSLLMFNSVYDSIDENDQCDDGKLTENNVILEVNRNLLMNFTGANEDSNFKPEEAKQMLKLMGNHYCCIWKAFIDSGIIKEYEYDSDFNTDDYDNIPDEWENVEQHGWESVEDQDSNNDNDMNDLIPDEWENVQQRGW